MKDLAKRTMVIGVLAACASLFGGCVSEVAAEGGPEEKEEPAEVSCWADFGPDAPGECLVGEERECVDSDPNNGPDFCREKCVNIDGAAVWGLKTEDFQCPFYESKWHLNNGDQCGCNTPLVLSFDNGHVAFTAEAGAAFDLTRLGVCHASDWPTSATPWLALDRNGDGAIEDGGELFGSATRLGSGEFARNGFEALRDLDADHNGVFDKHDPAFAHVVIWSDRNLDRTSQQNEMTSLNESGVSSIDLHDARDMRCDTRGNCEGERSAFAFVDKAGTMRQGTVIDVYMKVQR